MTRMLRRYLIYYNTGSAEGPHSIERRTQKAEVASWPVEKGDDGGFGVVFPTVGEMGPMGEVLNFPVMTVWTATLNDA